MIGGADILEVEGHDFVTMNSSLSQEISLLLIIRMNEYLVVA